MNYQITRYSSLRLRHKILKNRIVVPPMASETADLSGYVTQKTLDHYSRLATSGAALIFVEYSYVNPEGRSEANQLGIYQDDQIKGLSSIAKLIHDKGSLAGIQLTHAGGKSESIFTNGVLKSPSGKIVPVKDKVLELSNEMSLDDIRNWRLWFLEAAGRAVKAGFDIVELHAAHGYGLNQWLSPITNKRTDEYGGSPEKNLNLLLQIIQEIRATYPELLISVRMPGQDFIDGGLAINDAIYIATKLEWAGVDILNISSGIGGWRRPGNRNGEGYLVNEATIIQSHVNVPVIGVGGIQTGSYIDQLLIHNQIALAAVGRAILNNPSNWKENNLPEGEHA